MNNITIISGLVALVSFLTFAVSGLVDYGRSNAPRVGDVYVHNNPGGALDDEEKPRPFTQLYQVLEVDANKRKARIRILTVDIEGKFREYERRDSWTSITGYNDRLYRSDSPSP